MLFFYPLDFTFVCPSEIVAHNNRIAQFKERGVEVVGVSIDSQHTHYAWRVVCSPSVLYAGRVLS